MEDMPLMPMWSYVSAYAYSDEVGDVRYDVGQGEIAYKEVSVPQ